ncbi:MAG: cadherin domain-containing protein [Bacteroidales bacterium]|nr:cadherin domain-containing protein [Bacteroidales bacterium]
MRVVRFCAAGIFLFFFSYLVINAQGGYDNTYVLAVKQKYAIPENVVNGDYVGKWLKTRTWQSSGAITFTIETNYNNAFNIDPVTGLITIANADMINGKIVQQDTVINLIIRTSDAGMGYELDTAQIWVKENAYCTFIDFQGKNGTDTRENPEKDLDDITVSTGRMYCFKRGSVMTGETTALNTLISSVDHPLIFCAYGSGHKPVFSNGEGICFYLAATPDEVKNRIEHMYFYDIVIRGYTNAAYKVRRTDNFMGWYNCETYNCDQQDIESSFILSTSSFDDSLKTYSFEIINYYADTTSLNVYTGLGEISGDDEGPGYYIEPSHIKCGVGPIHIINSYFGKSPGWAVRFTSGVASSLAEGSTMKHCFVSMQWPVTTPINGYRYNIQIRQDNFTLEDCIMVGGTNGVIPTSSSVTEMAPDNLTIKNCHFRQMSSYGIWLLVDSDDKYKGFYNTIIENNIIEAVNGIYLFKDYNTKISGNKIYNKSGSGKGIISKTNSADLKLHYNVIFGYPTGIHLPVGSRVSIFNNTVNGDINCTGTISSTVRNNFYKSLTGASSQSNNLDIDAINTSEYFINFSGNDYRLKATAANAIDKGTNVGLKYDAAMNPIYGLPDIGAFEYNAGDTTDNRESNAPPVIEDHVFLIKEQNFSNLFIGNIYAYDNDAGQQLTYSLLSGNESGFFSINSLTGDLKGTTPTIFNADATQYNLTVLVTDDGTDFKSSTATVTVDLVKNTESNNPPVIENQEFQIEEQSASNLYIGKVYAYDNDAEQTLSYTLISGNESGLFEMDNHTGELRYSSSEIFNNATTSYKLVVQVTDNGEYPASNNATLIIHLVEQPTVFYIDPNNQNDAAEDGSTAHPFDSWEDINWKEGNTYLQKKGTTAHVDKINIFSNNVTLGSYGDAEELPIIISETNTFIIRAFEKSNITINNLHFIGENAVSCIYFIGSSSENNTIEKCNFEGAVNGVRIVDGNNYILRYNTFYNTEEAIYSYAQNTEIYYNIFTGNSSAINITSTSSMAKVYNNVFYDNRQGISNSYAELTLYNNIFYLTNAGDLAINNEVDKVISDFNIFYPEQTGFIKIGNKQFNNIAEYQNLQGVDLNSFSADPSFADAYNMNFSVREESPAIDAGKLLGIPFDFTGIEIPYGKGTDIGINEAMAVATGLSDEKDILHEKNSLSTYPNPSSGIFDIMIKSEDNTTVCPVQIRDLSGKLIYACYAYADGQGLIRSTINLSGAPKAIYLAQAIIDCKVLTERIIIN